MTVQTNIQFEVTDTYAGEANYSWVTRGTIETKPGKDYSNRAAVRRVKKELGWSGVRCDVSDFGDMIEIRPRKSCVVCFVTFHSFGSAS